MKAKVLYAKKLRRVGRGPGSGSGKTSGRGQKGAGSRSGYKTRPGFEGGQNPLYRRVPKRGFNNAEYSKEYSIVNLDRIAALDVQEVTPEILRERGVIQKICDGIKILGDGELKKAVTVKAHRFSKSAKAKIEKAGGQAILIKE